MISRKVLAASLVFGLAGSALAWTPPTDEQVAAALTSFSDRSRARRRPIATRI
ncbi:MAG: hypothetical protein IT437_05385 [Phycisphaerales bacterium]|nr:hypothetical protein [Phycisphaerales bacterium]